MIAYITTSPKLLQNTCPGLVTSKPKYWLCNQHVILLTSPLTPSFQICVRMAVHLQRQLDGQLLCDVFVDSWPEWSTVLILWYLGQRIQVGVEHELEI